MKIKTVAAGLMLALGAVGAQAATYSLNETNNWTRVAGTIAPSSSFTDWFSFSTASVPGFGGGGAAVTQLTFAGWAGDFTVALQPVSFTGLSLWRDADSTPGYETQITGWLSSIGSTANNFTFNTGVLASGNYALRVQGTTGTTMGMYGVSMAPVPEPETYAMFLAGLGLMGFIARRRSV